MKALISFFILFTLSFNAHSNSSSVSMQTTSEVSEAMVEALGSLYQADQARNRFNERAHRAQYIRSLRAFRRAMGNVAENSASAEVMSEVFLQATSQAENIVSEDQRTRAVLSSEELMIEFYSDIQRQLQRLQNGGRRIALVVAIGAGVVAGAGVALVGSAFLAPWLYIALTGSAQHVAGALTWIAIIGGTGATVGGGTTGLTTYGVQRLTGDREQEAMIQEFVSEIEAHGLEVNDLNVVTP